LKQPKMHADNELHEKYSIVFHANELL